MDKKTEKIIALLIERDLFFGRIARDMSDCYSRELFFSSLFSLFQIFEMSVKFAATEKLYINIKKVEHLKLKLILDDLLKAEVIEQSEYETLDKLRVMRNFITHSFAYGRGVEFEGIFYELSENESYKEIIDVFAFDSMKIFYRLLCA